MAPTDCAQESGEDSDRSDRREHLEKAHWAESRLFVKLTNLVSYVQRWMRPIEIGEAGGFLTFQPQRWYLCLARRSSSN